MTTHETLLRRRAINLANPYYERLIKGLQLINTPFARGLVDYFRNNRRLTSKQRQCAEQAIAQYNKDRQAEVHD